MEYEADGVTLKEETFMGEYCDSDAKSQAGEDATTHNDSWVLLYEGSKVEE